MPIVWGGYHATLAYRGILRERLADVVVLGPGERAALMLAQQLAAGERLHLESMSHVPNLVFADGRTSVTASGATEPRIVRTPYEFIGDMNELPPMDYSLFEPARYYTAAVRDLSYISSCGCPYAAPFALSQRPARESGNPSRPSVWPPNFAACGWNTSRVRSAWVMTGARPRCRRRLVAWQ